MNEPPRLRDPRLGFVLARIGGGLVLLSATLFVLRPFLVPIAWAGILAYVTWPLYRAVRRHTRRPRLSAGFFTLATALLIGVPVAWILVRLASEASNAIDAVRAWVEAGAPSPAWITERPWIATRLARLRAESVVQPTEVIRYATTTAANASGQLVAVAGGLANNAFKFAVTVTTLFFFYLDGERLIDHARRLVGVVFPQSRDLLPQVGAVVRGVVFGLLGTAIAQGVVAGIGFWIFGVPSPVALGALTTIGSLVPVGPMMIWGSAAIWLFANGRLGAAIGMAIWGAGIVSMLDNVLRPILIGGGTRIPFLLVFFGVLGGLMAFGLLGLFIGPVLLSVTFALVAEFGGRAES